MRKVDLQKHKFDERMKLTVLLALLLFAAFLHLSHSSMAGEVITLIIGLAGGNTLAR